MLSMAKRVDAYVGERIRSRRTHLGLTQEHLAATLKISYQQVQKYETGANRVSAGRLYQIAKTLGADISYFFEGIEDSVDGAVDTLLAHGGTNRSTIETARNFGDITDRAVRSAISGLIKSVVRMK